MESADIAHALSALPGLQVTVSGEGIHVLVHSLNDSLYLQTGQVRQLGKIFGPRGEPAVEFTMGDESGLWPLIMTTDDVVYAPAGADTVLDSDIRFSVRDAPALVAYSEMERDTRSLARSCESTAARNLDRTGGDLLLLRCFIAGAIRLGMRPVRAVAWWQRAWAALGGDVALPPFREDPVWDDLCTRTPPLDDLPAQRRQPRGTAWLPPGPRAGDRGGLIRTGAAWRARQARSPDARRRLNPAWSMGR